MGIALFAAEVTDEQLLQVCGANPSAVCRWTLNTTGNETLAVIAKFVVDRPASIVLTVLLALVATAIGRFLIRRFGRRLVARREKGTGPDALSAARILTLTGVLASVLTAAVWTIAIISILAALGVSLVPLLATAGVATAALGFGAQSIVRDFLAGFFMLFEGQFEVGDTIDVGEATGVVEAITLRCTQLRGVDGTVWHVPNGVIQRVGNTSQQWSRAVLDLWVAADSDLADAQQVIEEAAKALVATAPWRDVVLSEPEVWGVENVGPAGAVIRLVVKTAPGEQFKLLRALRVAEKEALDRAGIELPPLPGERGATVAGQGTGGAGR